MFRDLPAYGLYCRHVQGLRTDELDLTTEQPDARPAVVLDDVWQADSAPSRRHPSADGGPVFWLRSVRGWHDFTAFVRAPERRHWFGSVAATRPGFDSWEMA